MNKVFIIGRLTGAPALQTTQNSKDFVRMTVAVNRSKQRDKADYFDCIAWNQLAEICSKYLIKGQQVAIAGEMRKETYEDRNGDKRSSYNITVEDIEFLAKPAEKADEPKVDEEEDLFSNVTSSEDLPF
jgi:single-strand DNA-binding protein